MTEQTGPRVDVDALAGLLAAATPGVWKLWGMQVMADQDGTSNVDTAVPVAQTYFRDENGKPRTWDAALIVALVNAAPALLAEVAVLRAKVEAVEAATSVADWPRPQVDLHSIGRWSMAMDLRAALATDPTSDTTTDRSTQ